MIVILRDPAHSVHFFSLQQYAILGNSTHSLGLLIIKLKHAAESRSVRPRNIVCDRPVILFAGSRRDPSRLILPHLFGLNIG